MLLYDGAQSFFSEEGCSVVFKGEGIGGHGSGVVGMVSALEDVKDGPLWS